MKIKHKDLDIDKDEPFKECKLGRFKYADILTQIVSSYPDGFVLAINNEWGTGKTTFVKMWQQHLKNQGFKTLYFNAWENDFNNNPLSAMIAELKSLSKNDEIFKSVIEKGAILTKNILPELLKGLTKKITGSEELLEIIKNIAQGGTEILEEEVKEYTKKKETIVEFQKALAKYVLEITKNEKAEKKPLVFFIDELDRCRPSYAVEVLEQIKHLFSVEGIVFVLSIDKEQLAHAVRGVYGCEKINTDEYLRRFIDLEYSIPQPETELFVDYLLDDFSFKDFFMYRDNKYDKYDDFRNMVLLLFEHYNLTLRQQEKMLGFTRLSLRPFNKEQDIFPSVFFFLVFIKHIFSNFYIQIKNKELTCQEFSNEYANVIRNLITENEKDNVLWVEAILLHFYYNDLYKKFRNSIEPLIILDKKTGRYSTDVKSKYDKNGQELLNVLSDWQNFKDFGLSYFLEKIDLLENLNT